MNKTSDNAMDVDMVGELGNLNVEPSTQPNENSRKKIELSGMPIEMLEHILIQLEDESLLKASHVCTLFASGAETAFARKYFKKWYRIERNWNSMNPTKPLDKVMLNKYGGKIRKIEIVDGKEETLALVEQKCDNVKSLILKDVSRIIMLKDLKEAYFGAIRNLNKETFDEFIDINPRLETLEFRSNNYTLLAMLDDRLNNLKTLKYYNDASVDRLPPTIKLQSLEMLHLTLRTKADYIRLLQSINCDQFEKLSLDYCEPNGDDVIREICKFKSLVSLEWPFYQIKMDQVMELAAHLPRLTLLSIGIADDKATLAEKILSIASMFPQLSKLEIKLSADYFDRLSSELKSSANGFHAPFAKINFKIKLINDFKIIFITADYLFLFQMGSAELHWMANLNENITRKLLDLRRPVNELKFVNNCADRTFDIAALALQDAKCLDFKSNGPIRVKPHVLLYQDWFPRLKILKIHLEQQSANDFLRNLHPKFCRQIEELWLNTRNDAETPDMTKILAKFGRLKSLHLDPSLINFNENKLILMCRKLAEVERI